MRFKAEKSRSFDCAFVVDEALLRRLTKILEEVSPELEFVVGFTDGSSVHYQNVQDVVSCTNSPQRSISSISITSPYTGAKQARVSLRDRPGFTFDYEVSGEQRDIYYISGHLDEWVSAIRQWFSPFAKTDSPSFAALGAVSCYAAYLVFSKGLAFLVPDFQRTKVIPLGAAAVLAISALVTLFGSYTTCLMVARRIFPLATFAIGAGKRRHQFTVHLRQGVIAAFAIGVLASLLAAWISSW